MTLAFWSAFGVTVALLGLALWSGRTRRRRQHLWLAPSAVVALAITIYLAERLGRARAFPPDEMAIHLVFAKTAALLVIPVVATGLLTMRRPRVRKVHFACVALFAVAVLIATGTGIWVFSLSVPV